MIIGEKISRYKVFTCRECNRSQIISLEKILINSHNDTNFDYVDIVCPWCESKATYNLWWINEHASDYIVREEL